MKYNVVIGPPSVAAVYGSTHPEFAKYLYVTAPISLLVLNPLGFLCLEIGERRRESQRLSNATVPTTTADGNRDHKALPLTNKTRTLRGSSFKVTPPFILSPISFHRHDYSYFG